MTYCTGAHPEIRDHYRKGHRPTEFGNKVWPTSLVTIEYLAQHPNLLTVPLDGLRVLEIGCGFGLLGVYLALAHSCQVTCSDLDAHVLPIAALHARLNQVVVSTHQASFNALSTDFLSQFDMIIGAEVCYSDEVSVELTNMIQRAFEATVSHVIIADPGRPDFDDFYAFCKKRFTTTLTPLPGSPNGQQTHLLCVTGQ